MSTGTTKIKSSAPKRNPILDKDFGDADFKVTARKLSQVIKYVWSGKRLFSKDGKVTPKNILLIWNQNWPDYGKITLDEVKYLLEEGYQSGFFSVCANKRGHIKYAITPERFSH